MQARKDDPNNARESFQRALSQAQQLLKAERNKPRPELDQTARSQYLRGIADLAGQVALLQARLGNLPGALATIESSLNGQDRDQAIVEIATERCAGGSIQGDWITGEDQVDQDPETGRIAVACSLPTKTGKHAHLAD